MEIRPIRNEHDYDAALERIDALMGAEPDTPEGDELDVLATLVEAYEARHHPAGAPDPITAIQLRMEQLDLTRADLEPYIGHSGRVAEVLAGKRSLSLAMIRRLHEGLEIPLESLIRPVDRAS